VQTPFPLVPAVPWRLLLRTTPDLARRGRPQAELAAELAVETVRAQAAAEEKAG
jgi:hypothetical protein